ncbi:Gfo/Idh/MocA family oxidoreductase [Paenibacillus aurantius]|uniref:Gfo/Idh/MocA family oxidoreductase n=1 Tax=Paenibacillus aurantius TaxID=2918900 RepID=A0AA96RCI6_9BACL|nr:Gfo/Idh/MocA family oxidoreductase [Paenibacillus aurantius]WNQ10585.1 Gfo/Idh/MocA family oxidoreductase [Paenibacillus aurantius]
MASVRWGIIGCGDVTEVKSGPGFQKAEHSELVAVMRRDGAKAADYAQRHGVPKWYDDADALIRDPEVDAVYIATPPAFHKPYTLAAAAAGKPVYVEKPMAMSFAECEEMIRACREAGVPLFVAYYRRMLPRFLKIKELLAEGAIGKPRFVQTTLLRQARPSEADPDKQPWRVKPEIAGGGYFLDLASHTLDILDYLFGPVTAVNGYAANRAGLYPAEDLVTGSYVFESGVQGTGTWCFCAGEAADRNVVFGSEGKLSFSTFGTEPIQLTTAAGTRDIPHETPAHIQQPLIQTIVNELRGAGTCPSTGESAARTSRVMDAMIHSYYNPASGEGGQA